MNKKQLKKEIIKTELDKKFHERQVRVLKKKLIQLKEEWFELE